MRNEIHFFVAGLIPLINIVVSSDSYRITFSAGNAIQPICELLPAVECAAKRITLDPAKKTVRLRTASVPKTNSQHRV
jgi:hypothetical protein